MHYFASINCLQCCLLHIFVRPNVKFHCACMHAHFTGDVAPLSSEPADGFQAHQKIGSALHSQSYVAWANGLRLMDAYGV